MTETLTIPERPQQAPGRNFACRLRPKIVMGRQGMVPHMAEFELENLSTTALEIAHHMTALQHLNLVVCDADGRVVSEGHFGDRFAPTLEPRVLRLEPGEKFSANVHLFATVRRQPIPLGAYSVQAVYEYDGKRFVSQPVEVTV